MADGRQCLHGKVNYYGGLHCDLLTKADCDNCVFFCDRDKYFYSTTEYQGKQCCYIREKKGDYNHEYREVQQKDSRFYI